MRKLRAGEFAVNQSDIFLITEDAIEASPPYDLFAQVKYFASSKYHMLVFQANYGTFICIEPHRKIASAKSVGIFLPACSIPANYTQYYLAVDKKYKLAKNDIQCIMNWQKARRLWTLGESELV